MINHKLEQYHKGQPVIINIERVDRIYATLVDFTEDMIIVTYGNSKARHKHSYDEVSLDMYSLEYTAPDKDRYQQANRQLEKDNLERMERRIDRMFSKNLVNGEPSNNAPVKQKRTRKPKS